MSHETVQSLLGAYALDAVAGDEQAQVQAHLDECVKCRSELHRLRNAATWLSYDGADAPPGLWDKISESLSDPPPPLQLPIRAPHQRWRRPTTIVAAAAAATIFIITAGILASVSRGHHRSGADNIAAEAVAAMSAPGTRVARLSGTSGGAATAIVAADGHGYLLAGQLPPLQHRIYQLWGATAAGSVSSLGTIPGPGAYAITVSPNVGVVLVTVEEHRQAAPTTAAIVTGTLA